MTAAKRLAMSPEEIDDLRPHPGWSDGRIGYLWCRFDAVIDRERMIRAEITWGDDSESPENPNEDGEPTAYFDPELFIETNRPGTPAEPYPPRPAGERPWTSFVTWDGVVVPLSREDVVSLVAGDPAEILGKYADRVAALDVWDPSKGFGGGPIAAKPDL